MAKRKEITVTLYCNGVQVETLTPEQRKVLMDRLSKTMSEYYYHHPEEYELLPDDADDVELEPCGVSAVPHPGLAAI